VIAVGDPSAARVIVVLHGREMCGADLSPFAVTLAADAYWLFPDAPLAAGRARTWWPIDSEQRIRALGQGPMELSAMDPPGRPEARAFLDAIVTPIHQPFVLAGFSQGGMLAMDYVLHGGRRPAALALLSTTRIAIDEWTSCATTGVLNDLPVLVAHGTDDAELAFAAGEHLRDFAAAHGAIVQWLPFEGGHQLPFVVWRALRKLIKSM
jgi:phospholipase/carboxylesterase